MIDAKRFSTACEEVSGGKSSSGELGGIGTLAEKTLHAVLKRYYCTDGMKCEVKIGSYVADIVGDGKIIEIQTGSFTPLRRKLGEFLKDHIVTVVYPIARYKWVSWIDPETGEASKKRKSPKIGTSACAFLELCRIKDYLTHPNFRFITAMIDLVEYRYLNGWSYDRKRGSVRCERIPIALAEEQLFSSREDYAALLPTNLPERFTSKDFSAAAGIRHGSRQLSAAIAVLKTVGAVDAVDKDGRLIVYQRMK